MQSHLENTRWCDERSYPVTVQMEEKWEENSHYIADGYPRNKTA